MTSREKILGEIKSNKPAEVAMPVMEVFANAGKNLQEQFVTVLTTIGGVCVPVENYEALKSMIALRTSEGGLFAQLIEDAPGYNADQFVNETGSVLQHVQTVYMKGQFGVAENGAIWVSEKQMMNRMLPFICEYLVLVIDANDILSTMHDAYKRIRGDEDGYGAFIAGPSKTADIEQSLVIGAHGPLSLQVLIVG